MIFLMIMNWMFAMIFMFLSHPLSLGCILLIQTILICIMSGYMYMNFWFSYILLLIMIGGMLVMFMYMTSVASNEKFNLPKKSLLLSTVIMMTALIISMMNDEWFNNFFYTNFNFINYLNMMPTLNKFYNYPNMKLMIFLMIYLLMTLIAVVKITDKNLGPLRQK